MTVIYSLFLLLLVLFYWYIIDKKAILFRVSSIYIYTLFLTVFFLMPSRYTHTIFVLLWFLFYVLGVLVVNKVYIRSINFHVHKLILISLCIIFFIIGVKQLNNINISNISSLHEDRSNVSLAYWEYVFNRSLYIIPFIFLFVKFKNILIRFILFFLGLAIALTSLQKAPIVFAVFSIIFFYALKSNYKVSIKQSLYLLVSFISLSILISYLMYQVDILVTAEAVFSRIFIKPAKYSYLAMDMVDRDGILYYGGASFYTLFELLDLPRIRLGLENYYYIFGNYRGSANTPAFTGAYADYRMLGILYSFLLGIIFKIFDNTVIRVINTQPNVSNFILASYACAIVLSLKMNVTVMGSALLGEGLFFAMVITYISLASSSTSNSYRIKKKL